MSLWGRFYSILSLGKGQTVVRGTELSAVKRLGALSEPEMAAHPSPEETCAVEQGGGAPAYGTVRRYMPTSPAVMLQSRLSILSVLRTTMVLWRGWFSGEDALLCNELEATFFPEEVVTQP